MYKYIIYWMIAKIIVGDCPPTSVKPDQFGRDTATVDPKLKGRECIGFDTTKMNLEFSKRADAFAFYKLITETATKENTARNKVFIPYETDLGKLINIKIDSIKIK